MRLSLYKTVSTSFLFVGTYDLASGTMKFVQEQYIASAEYDLQFEFTPNTEAADGTCKQRINWKKYFLFFWEQKHPRGWHKCWYMLGVHREDS